MDDDLPVEDTPAPTETPVEAAAAAAPVGDPADQLEEPAHRRRGGLGAAISGQPRTPTVAIVSAGPRSGKENLAVALRGWVGEAVINLVEVSGDQVPVAPQPAELTIVVVPPTIDAMLRAAAWVDMVTSPAFVGMAAVDRATMRVLVNLGGPGGDADEATAEGLFGDMVIVSADLNTTLPQPVIEALLTGRVAEPDRRIFSFRR